MNEDEKRRHNKNLYLKRTYGITLVQALEILEAQDWTCPVCLQPLGDEKWDVDHDHVERRVRGILHRYCNHRLVGRHRDWELVDRIAKYLRHPPAAIVLGSSPTVPKRPRRRRKRDTRKRDLKKRV